jgi:hypothetical protein
MADVPAPVETNRGPRVRTNSKGLGSFIPPELKETGRQALNLASAIDPVQGILRGMSASGRAADTDLSPEERRAALIEAGIETAAPLAMMGLGSLAKQPVKATVLDILTPTGAPQAVVDDVSDPSRRAFMKGAVATGGIAAIAPDVITEALERVPAAVKKLKPIPNPIDIFTQNMKILRREMEEAYDAADDMPYGSTMSRDYDEASAEAYNEAIQNAEKLAYDLDATTEMDLRELISDIGPKQIAEAADESLEEISQALTDFRMVSEDEYIEQMIPLAEEIQRRGLLEVKDNGIFQYPYARTVVEDVEDYRVGENRARNNSAIIDRPRDLQMTEGDKYVTSNQQPLKQEQLRNIIIKGEADGESVEAINKKVVDAATRLKVPYPQRAFENPKVEYVNTQTIADNVAQFNFPRYDVGKFGGDFESGDMANMPGVLEKFQASGKETLKENIFNEGIKKPIEIEVVMSNGGINIGQGHHRLQAALELGIPEIPVIVTTKANPRAKGMEVMRSATLDTSGLKTGQTYSFSELGLKQRLKTPKETPEEIQARGGTVFSDFNTGDVSDRKFPQYETPMREGFFRVIDEKADGGEMRKGVGSLSETARRMNEGGEAKIDTRSGQEVRQSIRDALKNLNDTEIQDQWGKSRKELKTALDMLILQEYHGEYEPPVTQGVGSLSETARRMNEGGEANINYSLGDIEYRVDLEPHMDPLAEMGFDVNKIDYDMMYDRSNDRSQGSHFNPNNDRILISPEDYSSKGVAAHEMRHRGLERLFRIVEQGYPTAKKLGLSKEDYLKILRLYKLEQQQDRQRRVNDPDFDYSDYAHEKIAEGFEKDETINRGAKYFLNNPNAPVFTFDRKERRPTTPAERLALMQDLVRENAMSGGQAFGPDLAIQKSITSPTSMEAFRETGGRAEIDRYLDEGPQNTPENIVEFAEQALAAQRYADIINERNKTIMRNSSEYAMGGEVSGPPPDRGPTPQGIGSLSETARRMNEGGPSSIDDEINAIVPSVIMAESSNDPKAVSEDGAIGLMQVLPSTAMKPGYGLPTIFELAREQGFVVDEETPETATQLLFMPDLNVEFGSRYLKAMRNEYDTMEDALRAYNAGPGNFNDYLAKGRDLSALDDEAVQYPLRVAAAGQGINPNEPAQYEAFTDSPEAFSTFMNMASEERPPAPRPRARPSVTYDGPRPMQRPTLPQEIIGQPLADLAPPQNLQQKYSLEGIEQMLTGTNSELLLPRQFQQGSPYSSMR